MDSQIIADADVICGEQAQSCVCAEPPGHYPATAHACRREGCGGVWRGSIDGPDFAVIQFPGMSS